MENLKSYTCPECGSVLDVDRYKDVFDCPFCGTHFDVLDFHKDELLEEARNLIFSAQSSLALEKYEYILSIRPYDFELLYEYACAIDGVKALKELSINTDDPNNTHEKLRLLLANDTRYTKGKWSKYYSKLFEVITLANRYHDHNKEYQSLKDEAVKIKNERDRRRHYGLGAVIFAIAGFFCVDKYRADRMAYYSGGDIRLIWPFYVYLVLLAVAIGLTVFANYRAIKALASARKDRDERYNKALAKAEEIKTNKLEPLLLDYQKAQRELEELKPDLNEIQAANKPVVRSTGKTIRRSKQNNVCLKCGGELTLDEENKLYVCSHCGVSYDYSGFVGAPGLKARRELMSGDFELAEKIYSRVLEDDPGDFEANRGLILCAGKWRALPDLRLNKNLDKVDWTRLEERLGTAKKNTNRYYSEYFAAFENLLNTAKGYYEASENTDKDSAAIQNAAARSFRLQYKEFAQLDRKNRITNMNQNDFAVSGKEAKARLRSSLSSGDFVVADRGYISILTNHPDDAEALRGRILCAGRWVSVSAINLDQKFSHARIDRLDSRIGSAIEDSPEVYHLFFETFAVLAGIVRENSTVSEQVPINKDRLKEISEEFVKVYTELAAMDKELFSGG